MKKTESTKIRPSPMVIVKDFILLQATVIFLYLVAGSLTHYAQIYRSLPISQAISFQIAQALFILGVEIILIFYIFFRWHREYYEIKADQIVHTKGIFYRSQTVVPLSHVSSVTYHQGPLGKLAQYGTIELKDGEAKEAIYFKHIPDPYHCVNLIIRAKPQIHPPVEHDLHDYQPDLRMLMATAENESLEFKSSFRWDMKNQKVNRHLEKAVMKTIAAFLNSQGGHLVLGVDDNQIITGLASDYSTLGKPNSDGFENHFTHIFHNMIGAEFRQFVRLHWTKIDEKDCCVVNVVPAPKPAYLRTEDNEEFYIRTGNGTTSLKFSAANAYIDSRFNNKLT